MIALLEETHICHLWCQWPHFVTIEILVAKLVLFVKRTGNNAARPVQLINVILPNPTGICTDIWSTEACDQIVVPFVLDRFVCWCDFDATFVAMICSLQRSTECKFGAARDSLARCELVNVFEGLREFDHHSESDAKVVILNFEDELAVENEELKRKKNHKDNWKRRSQDLSALVAHTKKQLEEERQKTCFHTGRHTSNCGGHSLAARRNLGVILQRQQRAS